MTPKERADQDKAIAWCQSVLLDDKAIIVDTETTGLDDKAEIVEIAILSVSGKAKMNQLISPYGPNRVGARRVHKITDEMLANAPRFNAVQERIELALLEASYVIAYNCEFDRRLLQQSAQLWGGDFAPCMRIEWVCMMKLRSIAQYGHAEKWEKLEGGGHRALADCKATQKLIHDLAATNRQETLFHA